MRDHGLYIDYASDYDFADGVRTILFFHATWCHTCREADTSILASLDDIPENVVIVKVDYDSNIALREKYGVTGQHTFVEVNESGNKMRSVRGSTSTNDFLDDLLGGVSE